MFLAKYSVVRFNKNRPLRALCRKGYQLLSTLYCVFSPLHHRRLELMKGGEIVDTYPWPYNDILFANWPESSCDSDYTPVLDPSRSVVKKSTSYCAYKIYEVTGKWPKSTSRHKRFEPKDWREFLREAGYWEVDHNPSKNFYYVGVRDNIFRPYSEVVWLERYEGNSVDSVVVTTYDQKVFVPKRVRTTDYIWVKIARRSTLS